MLSASGTAACIDLQRATAESTGASLGVLCMYMYYARSRTVFLSVYWHFTVNMSLDTFTVRLQWNPINTTTKGPPKSSGHINGVVVLKGFLTCRKYIEVKLMYTIINAISYDAIRITLISIVNFNNKPYEARSFFCSVHDWLQLENVEGILIGTNMTKQLMYGSWDLQTLLVLYPRINNKIHSFMCYIL